MDSIFILAQADSDQSISSISSVPVGAEEQTAVVAQDSNAPVTTTQKKTSAGYMNLILIGVMFAVMWLLLFRGPRKRQQEHKSMVSSLQKNDRVRTVGGIFGTVVDVKGDEVVLKIDESNNTKIRVSMSAVGKKLTKEDK